jgi:hypothetical protein
MRENRRSVSFPINKDCDVLRTLTLQWDERMLTKGLSAEPNPNAVLAMIGQANRLMLSRSGYKGTVADKTVQRGEYAT